MWRRKGARIHSTIWSFRADRSAIAACGKESRVALVDTTSTNNEVEHAKRELQEREKEQELSAVPFRPIMRRDSVLTNIILRRDLITMSPVARCAHPVPLCCRRIFRRVHGWLGVRICWCHRSLHTVTSGVDKRLFSHNGAVKTLSCRRLQQGSEFGHGRRPRYCHREHHSKQQRQ